MAGTALGSARGGTEEGEDTVVDPDVPSWTEGSVRELLLLEGDWCWRRTRRVRVEASEDFEEEALRDFILVREDEDPLSTPPGDKGPDWTFFRERRPREMEEGGARRARFFLICLPGMRAASASASRSRSSAVVTAACTILIFSSRARGSRLRRLINHCRTWTNDRSADLDISSISARVGYGSSMCARIHRFNTRIACC